MLRDDVKPISVDDHVVEPPHVFVDHIEPKFRDRAPRIVDRDGRRGLALGGPLLPPELPGERANATVPRAASPVAATISTRGATRT